MAYTPQSVFDENEARLTELRRDMAGTLRVLEELREAARDLVACLDSPHTSVSTKWETGMQYKQALERCRALVR